MQYNNLIKLTRLKILGVGGGGGGGEGAIAPLALVVPTPMHTIEVPCTIL